jgi:choice-of-anchor B domain-containing protein
MKNLFALTSFVLFAFSALGQNFNLDFRSNVPYAGYTCSSCWGYVDDDGTEYALVGTSFGVSIVDITDPDNPQVKFNVLHTPSFWREIKTYGHYAYATNEDGGGLLVMDLQYLPDSVPQYSFVYEDANGFQQDDGHELWIDEKGRLFIVGGAYWGAGATIFDLTADPINPPYLGAYQNHYIHSAYVRNDTMWASEIFDGLLEVVDVSDPSNPSLMASWHTPGNFTHNSWLTSDGNHLFTADEIPGSYVTAYDVSELDNVTEVDKIQSTPGTSVIAHNVHLLNDTFAIVAYYCDGVVIFDVSHPDNMVKVGEYDTYPQACNGFNGTWGVYPWFPSGNIIASNIEDGLFVLTPHYVQAARLEGVATDTTTGALLNDVQVELVGGDIIEHTNLFGEYKTGMSEGGVFTVKFTKAGYVTKTFENIALTPGITTVLDAALVPSVLITLNGSVTDSATGAPIGQAHLTLADAFGATYELTADAGGHFMIPDFQTGTYDVVAGKWGHKTRQSTASITPLIGNLEIKLPAGYYDDFYFNEGWSQSGTATTGIWERAEPVGTNLGVNFINPEEDLADDFGDECYDTGNGGGNPSNDDVDGGYTALSSPALDLSNYIHPKIAFYYWIGSTVTTNTEDSLIVYLSNGMQSPKVAAFTTANAPNYQWVYHEVNVEDFITPGILAVSFVAEDNSPENVFEAAIDKFFVIGELATPAEDVAGQSVSVSSFPNPFTGQAMVQYHLPENSDGSVSLVVMNALGQKAESFHSLPAGGTLMWGNQLQAGIYYVQLLLNGQPVKTIKAAKQ